MDEREKLNAIRTEIDKWFSDEEKSAVETLKKISNILKRNDFNMDEYCEQLHDSVNV